jgi:nucleoid-associated protein YgaU
VHFVNGNADTLTMDLFFDTYTYYGKAPVTDYTRKLTELLDIQADLHAPPLVEFRWGQHLAFRAILERVGQRFTMFLEDGTPVRATLSVTFKEYKTVQEQIEAVKRNSSDVSKLHVVEQGDSLWWLAAREYRDPARWRDVARANADRIDNPRLLEPTQSLRLPPVEVRR